MNYIKMKDDNGEYTIEVESLADLDVCVEVMERLLSSSSSRATLASSSSSLLLLSSPTDTKDFSATPFPSLYFILAPPPMGSTLYSLLP